MRNLSVLMLTAMLLVSCGALNPCGETAESFDARANDFFEQVKSADYEASSDKWQVYDERLVQLVEECYPLHEEKLTGKQDRQFWTNVGAYYVQRYGKAGAKEALKKLDRGISNGLDKAQRWLDDTL